VLQFVFIYEEEFQNTNCTTVTWKLNIRNKIIQIAVLNDTRSCSTASSNHSKESIIFYIIMANRATLTLLFSSWVLQLLLLVLLQLPLLVPSSSFSSSLTLLHFQHIILLLSVHLTLLS